MLLDVGSIIMMRQRLRTSGDIILYALLLGGGLAALVHGAESSGYGWQWHRAWAFLFSFSPEGSFVPGILLQGLGVTLVISLVSFAGAMFFALCAVGFRYSGSTVATIVARSYIEIIRNTPLLIQLFIAYFVIAPVLGLDRFVTAVWALALFEGAYMAEILRSGIESVPRAQWEASRSLGMDDTGTVLQVIIPQALRRAIPPLTGQVVSLVKDSSLVSAIAVHELTMEAQLAIAETFLTFEIWMLTASLYLCVTLCVAGVARILEQYFRYET